MNKAIGALFLSIPLYASDLYVLKGHPASKVYILPVTLSSPFDVVEASFVRNGHKQNLPYCRDHDPCWVAVAISYCGKSRNPCNYYMVVHSSVPDFDYEFSIQQHYTEANHP